MFLSKPDNM